MPDKLSAAVSFPLPRSKGNRVLAILAVLSLAAAAGFWWWTSRTRVYHLKLSAGVELKYRGDLMPILCEEAAARSLTLKAVPNIRSVDAIRLVARGELDAAVVPAGLAVPGEDVRQVAMFDSEPLHLFVRPALATAGIGGLRGKRINLGATDGGLRIIATAVLDFAGLKAGEDYHDESYTYAQLTACPTEQMPDAVFSLSPLPSPMGEWLVRQHGYQLMELPFGAALALRKPYLEDASIPANTYGVQPPVPETALHTVGTRAVLVAHANVSPVAIRRLLEVFYESDFARRVGIPALNETLLQRLGEYPNHPGTVAYLHRHDPWVNKDLVDNVLNLRGLLVSVASALILGWQWYRRRPHGYLQEHILACTELEIEALRLAARQEFDAAQLERFQSRMSELQLRILEVHQQALLAGEQQSWNVLSRLESLQQRLPNMVRSGQVATDNPASLGVASRAA